MSVREGEAIPSDSVASAPQALDPNFRIELPQFEGPLDLLLHLISKHELDILNLPVAFVTERYLAYLDLMKELNLDVASEYLVMAAKLIFIKSRMLLPQVPGAVEEEDEEEQMDPREELIRRLLEYQKYKNAAAQLGERDIAGRDVFTRGVEIEEGSGPAPLAPIDMFKLLDAFQSVLKRLDGAQAFGISAERISIQERMTQIVDLLTERKSCSFEDLFVGALVKYEVVVTFLAILEMTKMRLLRIYQPDSRGSLHLERRLLDAGLPSYPPEAGAITSDGGDRAPLGDELVAAAVQTEDDDAEDAENALEAAHDDDDDDAFEEDDVDDRGDEVQS
jgi:segregation and condensation protein A